MPSKCNDPNDPEAPKEMTKCLNCTIYEFYNGSLKTFDFKRNKLMSDEKTIEEVEETMTVEVKPGNDTETVLTFPTKGNEAFSYHQAPLHVKFVLKDGPDCNYRRKGNDLIYTHSLSLEDALLSRPVQLNTLDYRTLILSIDQTITP